MNFNKHYDLKDKHAFLSPSSYAWLRYSDEKLVERYLNAQAIERGTRLHALAAQLITERIRPTKNRMSFNNYVNDAIGFMMTPEVPLFYSGNCFGHTDAISFDKNFLRIHDYKSGVTKASMDQLYIYDALFCLEYGISPFDIEGELRIYQSNDIATVPHDPNVTKDIMDKIITSDKIIDGLKE